MTDDRFIQSWDGVDVYFEPLEHNYQIEMGDGPKPIPSVSEIMEYVPKYLSSWGQKNGVKGMMELVRRSILDRVASESSDSALIDLSRFSLDDYDFNFSLIKDLGLDSDSIRDAAAARGTTVHAAFRGWVENGVDPAPALYSGEVVGYIKSLRSLTAALDGKTETLLCEQPIASPLYGVAGTPDWLFRVTSPLKVQKGGNLSKRPNYLELKPGELCLVDFKTSAQVYKSHTYQLSAYEMMARELGIASDEVIRRFVCLVKPDGEGVNFKEQPEASEQFLAALCTYNAEKRPDGWNGKKLSVGVAL